MIRFIDAWRRAFVGQPAAGPHEVWARLFRGACRVERSAHWFKVYAWRKSLRGGGSK